MLVADQVREERRRRDTLYNEICWLFTGRLGYFVKSAIEMTRQAQKHCESAGQCLLAWKAYRFARASSDPLSVSAGTECSF